MYLKPEDRLTALETKVGHLEQTNARLEAKLDRVLDSLTEFRTDSLTETATINTRLASINTKLDSVTGAIASRRELWNLAIAGVVGTAVGGLIVAATTGLLSNRIPTTTPSPPPQVQQK